VRGNHPRRCLLRCQPTRRLTERGESFARPGPEIRIFEAKRGEGGENREHPQWAENESMDSTVPSRYRPVRCGERELNRHARRPPQPALGTRQPANRRGSIPRQLHRAAVCSGSGVRFQVGRSAPPLPTRGNVRNRNVVPRLGCLGARSSSTISDETELLHSAGPSLNSVLDATLQTKVTSE